MQEWFTANDEGGGVLRLWEPHARGLIRSNAYLVDGGARALLVDAGCGVAPIRPYLPATRAEPLAVATHGHFDHVGGLHEFAARMIHEAEAAGAARPDPVATLLPARLPAPILEMFGDAPPECLLKAVPAEDFDPAGYRGHAAAPTGVLRDGDVLDLGDRRLEVLHLPGHSPGSIGLYEPQTATLFSGDVIYDGELVDEGLPGTDRTAYAASMRRIAALDLRVVYPGHGAPLTGERAHRIAEDYLGHGCR